MALLLCRWLWQTLTLQRIGMALSTILFARVYREILFSSQGPIPHRAGAGSPPHLDDASCATCGAAEVPHPPGVRSLATLLSRMFRARRLSSAYTDWPLLSRSSR